MKKILLSLLILSISIGLFSAQNTSSNVMNGFKVLKETTTETIIEFELPHYKIKEIQIKGENYSVIETETETYTTEIGFPMLPIFGTGIAVPTSGKVTFEIIESDKEDIYLDNIFPTQEEGYVYEGIELEKNSDFYNSDSSFPTNTVDAGAIFVVRDYRVKPIVVTPFSYNASSKKLSLTTRVVVKISTDTNMAGFNEIEASTSYSPAFADIYSATILNFDRNSMSRATDINSNLLFIHKATTDNSFLQKLGQYVAYKEQKGFNVQVANTTDIGSTSSTGIKNYIQGLYDGDVFKPDYVIIIGDVGGSFGIPTHNPTYASSAEGDYPYTFLAGNDLVGDIFIGRMSINNSSQFANYYGKMRSYELLSTEDTDDYLDAMLLVGDTAHSGESTVNNCKFVSQTASRLNPDYTYTELYGNGPSVSVMNQAINAGVGFYHYRGYIGMSGWNPGNAQMNVHKLNHAVIITCSTGNFASTGTTESYMNLGSESAPKGGISAIGMATSATHTSFNNSLAGGIFNGIMNYNQRTMGEALLTGKITTYIVYSVSDMSDVKSFTHWCNLIGDPTIEIFVGEPTYLDIETSVLYTDSEDMTVLLKDVDSNPVADANVSLTSQDGTIINSTTNNAGIAYFTFDTAPAMFQITANKPDYHPIQEVVTAETSSDLRITSFILDDDQDGDSVGNDSGTAEAGETLEINFAIANGTATEITNLSATMSCMNNNIDITNETATISSIQVANSAGFETNFVIEVSNNILDGEDIVLELNCTYNTTESARLIQTFKVSNGKMILVDSSVTYPGDTFDSGETATLTLHVKNISTITVENILAEMIIDHGFFEVTTEPISVTSIGENEMVSLVYDIYLEEDVIPGMDVQAILKLDNSTNFYAELLTKVVFGTPSAGDQLGPDEFGYVIYDSNDTDHPLAPVYDWIEIAPSNGGDGTLLDITDALANGEGDGVGANSTETIDLPFEFSFYGEEFNEITVCSNGFISFGANSNGEFRNYRLPGALGPNGMVAAFWDDMHLEANSGIYSYYNAVEDYFVIQWNEMVNGCPTAPDEETFQIILYNPQRYATSLNQGPIKIQYRTINNVDIGDPGNYTPWHANYATVGIESPDGTMGLEYTYNNVYPIVASPLVDNLALFITTKPMEWVEPFIMMNNVSIIDENNNNAVEPGEMVNIGITLTNTGITPVNNVTAEISTLVEGVTILNGTTEFDNLVQFAECISHSYFQVSLGDDFQQGQTIPFTINIEGDGYQFEQSVSLTIQVATYEVREILKDDYAPTGNNDDIVDAGENIKIALEVYNSSTVLGNIDAVSLTSANPNITIENGTFNDVRILGHSSTQVVFTCDIDANVAVETEIEMVFTVESAGIETIVEEYSIMIGQSNIFFDFEEENDMFLTAPWTVGNDSNVTAHSGSNVMVTTLSSNYPHNTNAIAWTPMFAVSAQTAVSFWHRYNFESNFDGGQVVLQVEGNQNIILITPSSGYDQTVSALTGLAYTGDQNSWEFITLPSIGDYEGQNVSIGFRIGSDGSVSENGWFIDDIEISGTSESSNMVSGNVSINGGEAELNDVHIAINDVIVSPNEDGDYLVILPICETDIAFSLEGYDSFNQDISSVDGVNTIEINYIFGYLNEPANLAYNLVDSLATFTWDYEEDIDNTFSTFELYRKLYTGNWDMITSTTEPTYCDTLRDSGNYEYKVVALYEDGLSLFSNIVAFTYDNSVDNDNNSEPIIVTGLNSNYPNPFNPETNISYSVAKSGKVSIRVYNLKGQLVKTLVNREQQSGNHNVIWHGTNEQNNTVASGVYFFRMVTEEYTKTNKGILLK